MYSILLPLILSAALMLMPAQSQSSSVIWLNEKAQPTVARGIRAIETILYEQEDDTRSLLERHANMYLTGFSTSLDLQKGRLIIHMAARTTGQYNTKGSCSTLIAKAKRTLFGLDEKKALANFFPEIELEQMMFFVRFHGTISTYGVENKNGVVHKEVSPYVEELPKHAIVTAKNTCRNRLFSDIVFYD